ncbi:MAG: pyridoxal phosphate-dependent aminotransferase [Candidatus Omnitrophica bacterium]|nr:pyridoxal phosphate-dependent aminotransferase [Candidatus Omnitrophota bacterium]
MEKAKRLNEIKPSSTLAITAKAKLLKKQGRPIINFAAGEPDFDTPEQIKEAAIQAIRDGFTKYTPASGTPELKKAVQEKFKRDNNLEYSLDEIIISSGAKHSLYNSLQAIVNPHDEVIIISPYWLSYPEMIKLAGGKPVVLETKQKQGFKIDQKALESLINKKTKALIINSPSNPTGVVYSEAELMQIAEIVAKNKTFILSDEIYEKLIFDGQKHTSIASLNNEIYKQTITINGVSKTYSMTGWRIGFLGAPKEIAAAVASLQSHSTSNPASISQKAAVSALAMKDSEILPFINEFSKRRDCLTQKLGEIPGISFFKPAGAFYVFVNISGLKIAPMEFASRLLDEEFVACIPAESFGSKSHVRLSFATNNDEIIEGCRRIKKFIESLSHE